MLRYLVLTLYSVCIGKVHGQICDEMNEYQKCARYSGCLCFIRAEPSNTTICVHGFLLSCSELVQCKTPNNTCSQSDYECIYHPRCRNYPVCYPVPYYNPRYCARGSIPNIPANATWKQNGTTIAGGDGKGNATNQLDTPYGLFVDDDQTVIIADYDNHRIVQWKKGDTYGQVIAGGNGQGNRLDQLNCPSDVLIDKETDDLIIADYGNRRVVRWSRRNDAKEGGILIHNITCWGLALDDQRYLYASDVGKHEVRRYRLGDTNGTLVAGGNDQGSDLNQLNDPYYLFVDRQQNVCVTDGGNYRVMKWNKDAKEGIVVAGGNGEGNALTQLSYPQGILVDTLDTLYVADTWNHRVMRWFQEDKQVTVVVGGNGQGAAANQFSLPIGLSFDRHGNLYVADRNNHRVQRFDIIN